MTVIPDSTGLFPRSQPAWAEQNIATFPVHVTAEVKKPGIRGYGKVGLRASRELAHKRQFARTDALSVSITTRPVISTTLRSVSAVTAA